MTAEKQLTVTQFVELVENGTITTYSETQGHSDEREWGQTWNVLTAEALEIQYGYTWERPIEQPDEMDDFDDGFEVIKMDFTVAEDGTPVNENRLFDLVAQHTDIKQGTFDLTNLQAWSRLLVE